MRLAYFAARFPLLSETFILNEMGALEDEGCTVVMFAIHREHGKRVHPDTGRFLNNARFGDNPLQLLIGQLYYIFRDPVGLLALWLTLLKQFGARPKLLWRNTIALMAGCHFARLIHDQAFDHLHAHWANHTTFAAYCVAQLTGLPFTFTAHANDIFVDQTMLAQKAKVARYLVTISEYNRRYLLRFTHPDDHRKIKVVRCGIDGTKFLSPGYFPATKNLPVFVCLARLHEKKGHQYLLEACAELVSHGKRFECWLIGDGALAQRVSADISRLQLSQTVKMLGPLSQPEVAQRLAAADYMVLPSITTASGRREGIPVSLMEGMAMGLTVITTELSGTPELVRHGQTGLLVPEKDNKALAAAMKRVMDEPKLAAELAVAGRSLVNQQYDLRKNSLQLLKLFKNSQHYSQTDVDSTALATGKQSR